MEMCPTCKDPFLRRINNLADSFNKGLLENSTCTNSCPNEEGRDGQNENQPDISTTQNANFYVSDD